MIHKLSRIQFCIFTEARDFREYDTKLTSYGRVLQVGSWTCYCALAYLHFAFLLILHMSFYPILFYCFVVYLYIKDNKYLAFVVTILGCLVFLRSISK